MSVSTEHDDLPTVERARAPRVGVSGFLCRNFHRRVRGVGVLRTLVRISVRQLIALN
jgi:hypothetical protein